MYPDRCPAASQAGVLAPGVEERLLAAQFGAHDDLNVGQGAVVDFHSDRTFVSHCSHE